VIEEKGGRRRSRRQKGKDGEGRQEGKHETPKERKTRGIGTTDGTVAAPWRKR